MSIDPSPKQAASLVYKNVFDTGDGQDPLQPGSIRALLIQNGPAYGHSRVPELYTF